MQKAVLPSLNRRNFLALGAGAVLLHSFSIPMASPARAAVGTQSVGVWVTIATDGSEIVTIWIDRQEMGQGIMTGLAQVFASEMRADWSKVKALMAPGGSTAGVTTPTPNMTAGSTGIRRSYAPMQKAGAQVREMLVQAAINAAGGGTATVEDGIISVSGGETYKFGQVALAASLLEAPASPAILGGGVVGTSAKRLDIPAKVNGSAIFGIDVMLPDMLFAVIQQCPTIGGTLAAGYTPTTPSGCLAAVVAGTDSVAVIAANTWTAIRGARSLKVSWVLPANAAEMDSAAIDATAVTLLNSGTPAVAEPHGGNSADTLAAANAIAAASKTLDATYSLPFLAHANMEPLNCTVRLNLTSTPQTCEIWAPTQGPATVANTAKKTVLGTALSPWTGQITVTPMLMGGGLGRKIEQDYIAQAIRTAQNLPSALAGRPVKLMWTREEDFGHDYYRPMGLCRLQAGIDESGNVTGWLNRIVSPSISMSHGRNLTNGIDNSAVEGAIELDYQLGTRAVEYVRHTTPLPVGYLRSVGFGINTFAVESAMDELAELAGEDPLAYRLRLLDGSPNEASLKAVLNAAATLADWGTAPVAGRARGLAVVRGFGSSVAIVAEISQVVGATPATSGMKIHKISCAVDCGLAINPDQVKGQMEGGIIQGISQALWGQIRFTRGVSNVRNFNNYRVLRLNETPVINTVIVPTQSALGGVGEPGVPAVAPALANAWAKLTGTRVRALPMFPAAANLGEDDD